MNFLTNIFDAYVRMVDEPLVYWFMFSWILDIMTGLLKPLFKNSKIKLDSTIGRKGIATHVATLGVVFVFYPFFDVINFDMIGYAMIVFYACVYSLSIVENLAIMGVPFPNFITERLEKIKEQANDGNISKDMIIKTEVKTQSKNEKVENTEEKEDNENENDGPQQL